MKKTIARRASFGEDRNVLSGTQLKPAVSNLNVKSAGPENSCTALIRCAFLREQNTDHVLMRPRAAPTKTDIIFVSSPPLAKPTGYYGDSGYARPREIPLLASLSSALTATHQPTNRRTARSTFIPPSLTPHLHLLASAM
ncbi:hypothetical protein J6590_073494 [Homalodisca vitripennis]|nr:hypothetical protein J6590_073494 [Homalodisca vitripennis]